MHKQEWCGTFGIYGKIDIMRAFLSFLFVLLLVQGTSANLNELSEFTVAKTSLAASLEEARVAKVNAEAAVNTRKHEMEAKEQVHKQKQEAFLTAQDNYWRAVKDYETKVANRQQREVELEDAKAQLNAARDQRDTCLSYSPSGLTAGMCIECLNDDYTCGSLSQPETWQLCGCNPKRQMLRTKLDTELQYTRDVQLSLAYPETIQTYEEIVEAKTYVDELEAELSANRTAVEEQQARHDAFLAELGAKKDQATFALIGLGQASEQEASALEVKSSALAELTTAEQELAESGQELKLAVNTYTNAQRDHDFAQERHASLLAELRGEIEGISQALSAQSTSAGLSLQFDGEGGYVEVPSVNLRTEFALEAWVYFDPVRNSPRHLPVIAQARTEGGDITKFVFILRLRGGPLEEEVSGSAKFEYYYWDFRMGSPSSPGFAVEMLSNPITPNGWMHVAVSVEDLGPKYNAKLYVNGDLQFTRGFSADRWSSKLPITIMKYHDSTGVHYGSGRIDELRIWNGKRTATEIRDTMKKTLNGWEESLRSYYKFDEDTSLPDYVPDVVRDWSDMRLDGKLRYPPSFPVQYVRSGVFEEFGSAAKSSEYALYLNGTSESPNHVEVPPVDLSGDFTMEFAFNFDPDLDDRKRLPKLSQAVGDGTTRERFVFVMELLGYPETSEGPSAYTQYFWSFKMGDCEQGTPQGECSFLYELRGDKFVPSGWGHVAVSITRNGIANLYTNGDCVATTECRAAIPMDQDNRLTSTLPISVGKIVDETGYYGMTGAVDELRFWNIARDKESVHAFMARTPPESVLTAPIGDRTLVAYYRFDEELAERTVFDGVRRSSADLAVGTDAFRHGTLIGQRQRVASTAFTQINAYSRTY